MATRNEIFKNLGLDTDNTCFVPPDKNKIELAKLDVMIDIRDELAMIREYAQLTLQGQMERLISMIWDARANR